MPFFLFSLWPTCHMLRSQTPIGWGVVVAAAECTSDVVRPTYDRKPPFRFLTQRSRSPLLNFLPRATHSQNLPRELEFETTPWDPSPLHHCGSIATFRLWSLTVHFGGLTRSKRRRAAAPPSPPRSPDSRGSSQQHWTCLSYWKFLIRVEPC
ncbi:hypothetical protein B0H63DRAFT_256599 [Podospora didyma]|uniref:Uncharacterized protein n=1 Tax=Podospora didyma TaxID=330526 RepID=A0AAE0KF25_9PEZI|nr:hypothetical protein B0H63DRAFT_256599 [Podospora didyma]